MRSLTLPVFAFLVAAPAGAQTISDEPTCDSCAINIEHMFRLNSDDVEDGRLGYARVTTNGDLYFATVQHSYAQPVKVYDSAGRFVADIADREGEGPGEYMNVALALPSHGDLMLFDSGNSRASVLSRDGSEFLSSWQLPLTSFFDAIRLGNGGLAVNSFQGSPEAAGKAIQLYEMGESEPYALVDKYSFTRKTFARSMRSLAAVEGGFLSIQSFEDYEIRAFTNSGLLARTYTRDAPWFDSSAEFRKTTPTVPPVTYVAGAYTDSDGLLWVFIGTADEDWAQALGEERVYEKEGGQSAFDVVDPVKLYDTVVEVIDLDAEVVVARARFDRLFRPVAPGIIETGLEDDLGFHIVDVFTVAIE